MEIFPKDKRCYRIAHFWDDEGGKPYSGKTELQILELNKPPEEIQKTDLWVVREIIYNKIEKKH